MAPVVERELCDGKLKVSKSNKSKLESMSHASGNGARDKKPIVPGDLVGSENKLWFEDKAPGDGSPMNSFSATTEKTRASVESAKNKSWYEIVEEDEEEEKIPLGKKTNGEETVAGVKIKQEKVEDNEESTIKIKQEKIEKTECKKESDKDDKKVPLFTKIKVEKDLESIIKKEKLEECKLERKPEVNNKESKDVKLENVGVKRDRDVKSSCSSESDSDVKEKRAKHQKEERRSHRIAKNLEDHKPPLEKDLTEGEPSTSVEDIQLARLTSMRKRNRDTSQESTQNKRERNHSTGTDGSSTSGSRARKYELETDPATLTRRQKQIDFGKNTVGYDRYRAQIPKEMRTKLHPRTPPKNRSYSRRAWDGMVKIWRQKLHVWDPPGADGEFDSMSDISTTNSSSNLSDDYVSTADSFDDRHEDCLDLGQD